MTSPPGGREKTDVNAVYSGQTPEATPEQKRRAAVKAAAFVLRAPTAAGAHDDLAELLDALDITSKETQ